MGMWSEQLRKKSKVSTRPVKKRSSRRVSHVKTWSKKMRERKNFRLPGKLLGELHRDLPRKILITLITFLMIYFTSQINQAWSSQVMEFLYRVVTQQPNYSELIEGVVRESEIIDELEILPVFEELDQEIFAPQNYKK